MRAGLAAYEILSGFQNHRIHRRLSRSEILSMAPGLPTEDLKGGWRYYDATVSDNRWTLETIKDGVRHGGIALNYAPVIELLKADGKIRGITFRDTVEGRDVQTVARAVINATGVFADRIRRLDNPRATSVVRLSKGTHLVFHAKMSHSR